MVRFCTFFPQGRGNRQPSGGSAKIPGMPRGAQVIATWSRALVDPSRTVQEGAFSVGANQIIVVSKDRGLSRDNYAKSLTIYDFTGNSMVSFFFLTVQASFNKQLVLKFIPIMYFNSFRL